jgi:2-oxoglutarate ferredoxin oxidoreductase subunit gamma
MRKEIRIAGFGGQGIALAGLILGKAAAIFGDLEAVMTQSYGPEARGGASSANVIISDEPIDYPFVQHPDILVVMSQEGYSRFRPSANQRALILVDGDLVEPDAGDCPLSVPATQLAVGLGRRVVANVVMLGFFTATTRLLSREMMEQALRSSVRPHLVDLNLKAFALGFEHPCLASRTAEEQAHHE